MKFINSRKATTFNTTPPKALKISSDVSASILKLVISEFLSAGKFPSILKLVGTTPIHKKEDYRPN